MTFNHHNKNRLVYSTDRSREYCSECGEVKSLCSCSKKTKKITSNSVIDLRREVKGRRGKTVTILSGLSLSTQEINALAADLKRHCGTGGSVKGGMIIIQGDHRQKAAAWLEKKGFNIRLAGG